MYAVIETSERTLEDGETKLKEGNKVLKPELSMGVEVLENEMESVKEIINNSSNKL